MKRNNDKIDFVVLWVNPRDEKWQKTRAMYAENIDGDNNIDNSETRYRDWDLFRYWFRGVEKYAPWVNKVHLVTCGHVPEWLNCNHPKLNIVKHADFIPKEALPTFNSNAIELCVHKIPGLAEQFVLFNDDTFIIDKVKPEDFFKKGKPVNTMSLFPIIPTHKNCFYDTVANDVAIINKHFDFDLSKRQNLRKYLSLKQREWLVFDLPMLFCRQFVGFRNYHIPVSYLKSTFESVWNEEPDLLRSTIMSRFRDNKNNVNHWLMNYWQFATGNFEQRDAHFGKSIQINDKKTVDAIRRQTYRLLCLNDNDSCDYDAVKEKIVKAMEYILPNESEYEKTSARKKTILYVIHDLINGGTSKYLLNLVRYSSKKYNSVVVCLSHKNELKKEFNKLGAPVVEIAGKNKVKAVYDTIRDNRADVVYAVTYYVSIYALVAAFLARINVRIMHSHGSGSNNLKGRIKRFVLRLAINVLATKRLACGKDAGKKMFGRHSFEIINNGIDISQYRFNSEARTIMRKRFGIEKNCVVIGSVGRLDTNKNQRYMVDILSKLVESDGRYRLILVGDGEERLELQKYVELCGVKDKVLFFNNVRDAHAYYNMMDIFLLTSFREGFPYVLIEAQANGLPVLVSSSVDRMTKINNNLRFLDLDAGAEYWADVIRKMKVMRTTPGKKIEEYSIEKTIQKIEKIYEDECGAKK